MLEEEREYLATNVPLRNSQNTVMENFDSVVSKGHCAPYPTNDGTNCSSFLCVAICDRLMTFGVFADDTSWVDTFKAVA